MAKIVDNHVARRLFPVEATLSCPNKGDIVTYVWKQKVTKVGDGDDDYVVEEVAVEESRVNRQKMIQSYADDVGVLNILEKVRRSGDITLLNQTGAVVSQGLQDYTKAPTSVGDALEVVSKGANSFAALKEIFGDVSFDQLANMSEADITAALNKYVASKQPVKEGE